MASIKLNKLHGGRGFVPTELGTSQTYLLSAATSPLVLTPPAGKVLRLDSLLLSDSNILSNTSIEVGGIEVVRGDLRIIGTHPNAFAIGRSAYSGGATTNFAVSCANKEAITAFEPDQSISISTTDGSYKALYFSVTYGDFE